MNMITTLDEWWKGGWDCIITKSLLYWKPKGADSDHRSIANVWIAHLTTTSQRLQMEWNYLLQFPPFAFSNLRPFLCHYPSKHAFLSTSLPCWLCRRQHPAHYGESLGCTLKCHWVPPPVLAVLWYYCVSFTFRLVRLIHQTSKAKHAGPCRHPRGLPLPGITSRKFKWAHWKSLPSESGSQTYWHHQ